MKKDNLDIEKRFWSKVEILGQDDCWNWVAGVGKSGYGVFQVCRKSIGSNRFAWISKVGNIPAKMMVFYKCDNRKCCNPNHLFLGTNKDNMNDRDKKGRQPTGEKNGSAKLLKHQITKIRDLYSTQKYYQTDLAIMFNISIGQVNNIVNFKSWK